MVEVKVIEKIGKKSSIDHLIVTRIVKHVSLNENGYL
ncbi:hypothetical protein QFZ28_005833 [Neobacillus niacini]|nr:hypothetical protein [Neobacillus niacini]